MITIVAFDFSRKTERAVPEDGLSDARAAGAYCWVDLECDSGPDAERSRGRCEALLRTLGLNEVALAEVLGPDREGRCDVYEDCLHFAVTEATRVEDRLETTHVDVVLGDRYLVTFRRRDAEFVRQMRRTYREDFLRFSRSPGFLLYEIGDTLIERYRRTLNGFQEAVEQVQRKLFGQVNDEIFRNVAGLTQDLLVFRKAVLASRELMHELATRRSPFISETTQPFLANLAGTLERLGGDLATEREVLSEMLTLYMGMVSHRTNKVINRLTVISVIFLPLSFLCGVYGVNLSGVPEFGWKYGYAFFWAMCFLVTIALLIFMRRRKWI
jgi:magnesium transporter